MSSHKRKQRAPSSAADEDTDCRHVRQRLSQAPPSLPSDAGPSMPAVPPADSLQSSAPVDAGGKADLNGDSDRTIDGESDCRSDGESDGRSDGESDGRSDSEVDNTSDDNIDGISDGAGDEGSDAESDATVRPADKVASEDSSEAGDAANEGTSDEKSEDEEGLGWAGSEGYGGYTLGRDGEQAEYPEVYYTHDSYKHVGGRYHHEDDEDDEGDGDEAEFDEQQYEESEDETQRYEGDDRETDNVSDDGAPTAIFSTNESLLGTSGSLSSTSTTMQRRLAAIRAIRHFVDGDPEDALDSDFHPMAKTVSWGTEFIILLAEILFYSTVDDLNAWLRTRIDERVRNCRLKTVPKDKKVASKKDLETYLKERKAQGGPIRTMDD